jgi:hypothetical protein
MASAMAWYIAAVSAFFFSGPRDLDRGHAIQGGGLDAHESARWSPM